MRLAPLAYVVAALVLFWAAMTDLTLNADGPMRAALRLALGL